MDLGNLKHIQLVVELLVNRKNGEFTKIENFLPMGERMAPDKEGPNGRQE